MKKISQLRAISYAYSKKATENRIKFLIEHENGLKNFYDSKYKSLFWYIFTKYQIRIY